MASRSISVMERTVEAGRAMRGATWRFAAVMLVPSAPAPAPDLAAWPAAAALGVLFFVVCGAAMSVDLPDSRAPLSRLSG